MRKTRLLLLAEGLLDRADVHIQEIPAVCGENPLLIMGRALAHTFVAMTCCVVAWGIASFAMVFRLRAVK